MTLQSIFTAIWEKIYLNWIRNYDEIILTKYKQNKVFSQERLNYLIQFLVKMCWNTFRKLYNVFSDMLNECMLLVNLHAL